MHPLSISATEPVQPNLKDLLRTLVVVMIIILVADYLAGLIIPRLTNQTPAVLPDSSPVGVVAMWKLSQTVPSLIAFTGSSEMQTGASSTIFDQQIKAISNETVHSVNVSIVAATMKMSGDVFQHVLIPHGIKTVFYGVESRAFHLKTTPASQEYLRVYNESPLGFALSLPPNNVQSFFVWLTEHSALIRYRTNMRRWLNGQFEDYSIWIPRGIHSRDHGVIDDYFVPFKVEEQYYQAFQDVLQLCHQTDMHCYIINMPLHKDAYQYIPLQDAKNYKIWLYNTVRSAGFTLWDFDIEACFDYLGDKSFYDLNHLNTEGAVKFTQRLALIYLNKLDQDNIACPEVIKP